MYGTASLHTLFMFSLRFEKVHNEQPKSSVDQDTIILKESRLASATPITRAGITGWTNVRVFRYDSEEWKHRLIGGIPGTKGHTTNQELR